MNGQFTWEPSKGSASPSAPHLPPHPARFPLRGLRDRHLPHHTRSLRSLPRARPRAMVRGEQRGRAKRGAGGVGCPSRSPRRGSSPAPYATSPIFLPRVAGGPALVDFRLRGPGGSAVRGSTGELSAVPREQRPARRRGTAGFRRRFRGRPYHHGHPGRFQPGRHTRGSLAYRLPALRCIGFTRSTRDQAATQRAGQSGADHLCAELRGRPDCPWNCLASGDPVGGRPTFPAARRV